MIELGTHTDNWRVLSGNFQTAVESAVKHGLAHIEFGVIENIGNSIEFLRGLLPSLGSVGYGCVAENVNWGHSDDLDSTG